MRTKKKVTKKQQIANVLYELLDEKGWLNELENHTLIVDIINSVHNEITAERGKAYIDEIFTSMQFIKKHKKLSRIYKKRLVDTMNDIKEVYKNEMENMLEEEEAQRIDDDSWRP